MRDIKYRPDIDGFRAIAVLLVIAFHFNKSWLPSGFIGVDIFFVISGYIITTLIYPQIKEKNFSFILFYEKRIKRILPLYYVVAFVSLVIAYFIFLPAEFSSFASSLRYATGFIANIYFERNTGYFAPTAETLPLLNTWSLAVEEQFYVVWPIVLIVMIRALNYKKQTPSPKIFFGILILALSALVIQSDYLSVSNPPWAYFLLQGRAFELLLGAILAIGFIELRKNKRGITDKLANLSCLFGVSLLVFCLVFLDKTDYFPGVNALLVCLAAGLIIAAGENENAYSYQWLSQPVLVYIGKLSYSLYLWHWPIQSFYRYYFLDFGIKGIIICSGLTIILSWLSFTFIETPLRYLNIKTRYVYICYLILPIIAFILMAKAIEKHNGYPTRFDEKVLSVYYPVMEKITDEKIQRAQLKTYPPFNPMLIGDQRMQVPTAFVWGDSHAGHFSPFVDELGKAFNFSALIASEGACPPIASGHLLRNGKAESYCETMNAKTLATILASDAKYVFLGGRWAMYTETTLAENEPGRLIFYGDSIDNAASVENSRRVLEKGLSQTIEHLIKANKQPIIFGQMPSFPFKPSSCILKKIQYPWLEEANCNRDYLSFKARYDFTAQMFKRLQQKYPSLIIIDPIALVCSEQDDVCLSELNGHPFYYDNNHINSKGARIIYQQYMQQPQSDKLKALF